MTNYFPALLLLLLVALLASPWCNAEGTPVATPAATAADWKADAAHASAAATHQADETSKTAPEPSAPWWSWALGAGGVLLSIARIAGKSNPIVALVSSLLDAGWTALAPRVQQQAEERRDQMADGLMTVVHLIDQFPPGTPISDLKKALTGRLAAHPLAAQAINEWITAKEKQPTPAA